MPYFAQLPYRVHCRQAWASLGLAAILVFVPGAFLRGQSGISTEGPFTVFRTGTGEPLLSLSVPFDVPPSNAPAMLRFEFGFATDEPDVPGTFSDSFSVTLQRNDQSATALLLTADRSGVQWAPPTAGGLNLNPADIQRTETNLPSLTPDLATKFAFSVSFILPSVFAGGPLNLFFDLFDNLNSIASLAFVRGVRIESTALTVPTLHSTSQLAGPFSEERGAVLDETNQTFVINRPTGNRFFQVLADRPTRIVGHRIVGSQLVIEYSFDLLGGLRLTSSETLSGPFEVDSGAVWNRSSRTFTRTKLSGKRFFRIRGDQLTRITTIQTIGNDVVIEYSLVPAGP